MTVGLYFGSYNPIHIGHLIVANTMIEEVGFDEVWLVISPQNPFKDKSELADESERKAMAELAVDGHEKIKICDIEFALPKPSYTIDTLSVLFQKHPQYKFSLIMGKDNLVNFDKWKNYEQILNLVNIHVYDRKIEADIPHGILNCDAITNHDFPLVEVSSTMIRKKAADGNSIKYWVVSEVEEYIAENSIYAPDEGLKA